MDELNNLPTADSMQFVDENSCSTLFPELQTYGGVSAELEPQCDRTKRRLFWNKDVEQRLFELWGRDNWVLNRVKRIQRMSYYAQWAAELKNEFDFNVTQEEIQIKVNGARSRYTYLLKQTKADGHPITWRHFKTIELILANQYFSSYVEQKPQNNNAEMDVTQQLVKSVASGMNGNAREGAVKVETIFNNNGDEFLCQNNLTQGSSAAELAAAQLKALDYQHAYIKYQLHLQQVEKVETAVSAAAVPVATQPVYNMQPNLAHLKQEPLSSNAQMDLPTSTFFFGEAASSFQQPKLEEDIDDIAVQNTSSNTSADHIMKTSCDISSNGHKTTVYNGETQGDAVPQKRPYNGSNNDAVDFELVHTKLARKQTAILEEERQIARARLNLQKRQFELFNDFLPKCLSLQQQILQKLNDQNN